MFGLYLFAIFTPNRSCGLPAALFCQATLPQFELYDERSTSVSGDKSSNLEVTNRDKNLSGS